MLSPEERNDRTWGTLIHLSSLSHWFMPVPGFSIFAPLILWLIKRHDSPFLDEQGKEAVNFNISFALLSLALVAYFLMLLLSGNFFHNGGILVLILPPFLLMATHTILVIMAALQANNGMAFRYPLTIRFLK